jgi:uncharacterized protein (DUF697 family)
VIKAKEVIGKVRNWFPRNQNSEEPAERGFQTGLGRSAKAQSLLIEELNERLEEAEVKLASAQLQAQHDVAQNIVKTHMIAGASFVLMPVPVFDLAALTGTQLSLLRSLSAHYDVDFDEQNGKALLTSLVSGAVPVLTVVGLSSFAKLIPGIGSIGGGISMTVLTSALVYATGQVFIRHFEQGGTLENFRAKHWKSFFTKMLEEKKITLNNSNNDRVGAHT